MASAKKMKLEKVIKSINKKKDVLTLECEWAVCDFVCNDTDSFLVHISQHIDQLMMCEAASACKNSTGICSCFYSPCREDVALCVCLFIRPGPGVCPGLSAPPFLPLSLIHI